MKPTTQCFREVILQKDSCSAVVCNMYPSTDRLLKSVELLQKLLKKMQHINKMQQTTLTEVSSGSSYLVKFTTQIKHYEVQINKPHD